MTALPVDISAKTKVADVSDRYPQTLQIFVQHRLNSLKNPVLGTDAV
ncbi:MAG TPA: hypothetical protein DHU55_02905 [Blastocatellia bacterium]|nr:hypothetical protein [Blastocatellia bacterium]